MIKNFENFEIFTYYYSKIVPAADIMLALAFFVEDVGNINQVIKVVNYKFIFLMEAERQKN